MPSMSPGITLGWARDLNEVSGAPSTSLCNMCATTWNQRAYATATARVRRKRRGNRPYPALFLGRDGVRSRARATFIAKKLQIRNTFVGSSRQCRPRLACVQCGHNPVFDLFSPPAVLYQGVAFRFRLRDPLRLGFRFPLTLKAKCCRTKVRPTKPKTDVLSADPPISSRSSRPLCHPISPERFACRPPRARPSCNGSTQPRACFRR